MSTRLPLVTGIWAAVQQKMDRRCTSLPCTEPEFSALLFTFDPPASKAALKVLCKEWKEAVTNWQSRELKNQDHRSSFLVSFLCNAGRTTQTDVRQYTAAKWARKVPSDFGDRMVLKIFCRNAPEKQTVHFWAMLSNSAGRLQVKQLKFF